MITAHRSAVLLVLAVRCACAAQRTLVVTSDPPDAEVRLDERMVGHTPVTIPFDHYGSRRVTLRKEGYLSRIELLHLSAPWYSTFPLDLFTEVLFPVGWKDTRHLDVKLEPGRGQIPPPDLESVLGRAEELRRAGPEGPRSRKVEEGRPPAGESPADRP